MEAPQTWPGVQASMDGFPFPELSGCREGWVRLPSGERENMVVKYDGEAFVLTRSLNTSIFGEVLLGFKGRFSDLSNPYTFARAENPLMVAIKRSGLDRLRQPTAENVFREIAVMKDLVSAPDEPRGCAYVMPLVAACLSDTHLYVVTPFCSGGDLLAKVNPNDGIEEPLVQTWFKQIFIGVGYIHRQGLCHHDLSPENIVITGDGTAAIVMDFGMVQRLDRNEAGDVVPRRDSNFFGKMKYTAPEIFRREDYDGRKTDIWSIGVTLLVCLAGEYPWDAPTTVPTRQIGSSAILKYSFLAQHGPRYLLRMMSLDPPRLSESVVDLLCKLLLVAPANRPSSATEMANHHFFM
ncbi:unnamed protein product [Ascophyllum nodosum]